MQQNGDRGEFENQPALRRRLGLALLTLYGIGTTVGAGIYVLIGEIVLIAGTHAWISFLVAAFVVAFTCFSFIELALRMPESAGEALYVRTGFNRPALGTLVGMLVIAAGLISAASVVKGAVTYLAVFVVVPESIAVSFLTALMALVAFWGIGESTGAVGLVTLIEVGVLILLVAMFASDPAGLSAGGDAAAAAVDVGRGEGASVGVGGLPLWPVMFGAVLAFFAFIGFEDMVNVVEEVRDPEACMPAAMLLTLAVTVFVYVAVALVAIEVLRPADFDHPRAPLSFVFERVTGLPPAILGAVGLLATLNGVLVQMIMAPRVLYGLARRGQLPAIFAFVHPATRTPWFSTIVAGLVVGSLAIAAPISELAALTSDLTLTIFILCNAALIRIKLRAPARAGFRVPLLVPAVGIVLSAGLLFVDIARKVDWLF